MTTRSAGMVAAVLGGMLVTMAVQTPASPTIVGAQVTVSPAVGPPTTPIDVKGRGFEGNEMVDVQFDEITVTTVHAKPDGRFRARIDAPDQALPGDHTVTGVGEASGFVAETIFLVRTNWSKLRFDSGNTSFNPYENAVSVDNVRLLQQRWSMALDGYAAPNPVVVDGVAYAASYYGLVDGLDVVSGAVVWEAGTGGLMSGAAPAVADGMLFTGSLDGQVIAFDLATEEERWRVHVRGPVETSPVVRDGLLYVVADALLALDAATGAVAWTSTIAPVGSPAFADDLLIAADDFGFVSAVDPATGSVVWSTRIPNLFAETEVVVADEIAVVGANDSIYALDALSGVEVWRRSLEGYVLAPAVAEGVVYETSGDRNRHLEAMDLDSGDVLWSKAVVDDAINPIVANGIVYVAAGGYGIDPHKMYAYEAASGNVLWTSGPMTGHPLGVPAISDGVLYAPTSDGTVYAFAIP